MQIIINKIPSAHKEEDITTGIKPIDREDANVEVEKGELVLKPDLSAIYKAYGKPHTKGGTPVNLEAGSFIFSHDKSLALNKEDHDLLELKKGGTFKASKNTPAEVLKRNIDVKHYNKMSATIQNPYKDDIAKNTAMLMLGKYQESIGKIAYAQEEKKGFPTNVPDFARDSAPIYDDKVKEDINQQQQYMKYGGNTLPSFQPGGRIPGINGDYRNGQWFYYSSFFPNPNTNQGQDSRYGRYENGKWIQYSAANEVDEPVNQSLNPFISQYTPPQKKYPFNPPQGWRDLQGKTYDEWRSKPDNITEYSNKIETPNINGTPEQPFGFDTKLNWVDKMNIGNAAYNSLNINRYMPMRSQIRTSPIRLERYDPQGAINQANQAMYDAYSANKVLNPYLAAVQNQSIAGRQLGALNQIRAQYDQMNNQVGNQEIMANAQAAQQNAMQNAGFDQQYYKETIEGAKNFDNMRSVARNELFGTVSDAYDKAIQSSAMNMQLGPNSAYYFDYGKMKVIPNPNRNIFKAQSDREDVFDKLLARIDASSMSEEEKIKAITNIYSRMNALKQLKGAKKGGRFNPFR